MPYLNLAGGEPCAETWGVIHFPDDEAKRRAYIAGLWLGFYPKYEKAGRGEAVPRSVLLSVMEAASATTVERDEIADRRYKGLAAGEQLRVLFAIAQTEPKLASWNAAARLVGRQTGKSRAYLYEARHAFLPVIHLWAAYILRDRRFLADESRDYKAIDDLQMFIAEAMALLQWGTHFRLGRKKAEPPLNRQKVDFWTPPPDWSPPIARPEWPRDGRLQAVSIGQDWIRRIRARPPRKNLSNPRRTNQKQSPALSSC
jgi:hypothetical protein